MRSDILGIGLVLIATSATAPLQAARSAGFSGSASGSYELFDADIDPVDILIDDGSTINSGAVKFELDPTKASSFKFNFDKVRHSYKVGLLVDIEALRLLGIPKQTITISLVGPITGTDPAVDEVLPGEEFDLSILSNTLTGGGTFDPGQFLSGWSYKNLQINNTNITQVVVGSNNSVTCDTDSTADGKGEVTGNLVTPGGKTTPLKGTGTTKSKRRNSPGGLICTPPIPGPLPLLGVGAAFGYSRKLRKHNNTCRNPEVVSAIG